MLSEKCRSSVWGNSVTCFICSCLDAVVLTAGMKSVANGVASASSWFLLSPPGCCPCFRWPHRASPAAQLWAQLTRSHRKHTAGPNLYNHLHVVLFNFLHWTRAKLPDAKDYWAGGMGGWSRQLKSNPISEAADCLAGPLIEFPDLHWRWRPVTMETVSLKGDRPLLQSEFFPEGQRVMLEKEAKLQEQWSFLTNIQILPGKSVLASEGEHLELSKCQGSYCMILDQNAVLLIFFSLFN